MLASRAMVVVVLSLTNAGIGCTPVQYDDGVESKPSDATGNGGEHVFDLGIVKPNTTQQCEFIVTNDSSSSAQFEKFVLGCSCLSASIEQKMLPPGETTALRVSVAMPNCSAKISRNFSCVFQRDGKRWEVPLAVIGIARSDLVVAPHVLHWAATPNADVHPATFIVTNFSSTPWDAPTIYGLDATRFELSRKEIDPPEGALQAWQYTARPLLDSLETNRLTSSLAVSGWETEDVEQVKLSVIVKPALACLPDRIFVNSTTPQRGSLRLLVRTSGPAPKASDFRFDNPIPGQLALSVERRHETGELRLLYSCNPAHPSREGVVRISAKGITGELNVPFRIVSHGD